METIQQSAAPADGMQNLSPTDSLHQYATPPVSAPPPQAPAPNYPQYAAVAPVKAATVVTSQTLAAGMFGLIMVTTSAMGANLHKVQDGGITMGEALSDSLVKGAAGGIAAASATAASASLTNGGIAGLTVILTTATGISYLLSK